MSQSVSVSFLRKIFLLIGFFFIFISLFTISSCKKEPEDDDDEIPIDTIDTIDTLPDINPLPAEPSMQTTPWPQWVFYHWVWEDESTQVSAQQLVDDYLAHDIPVGAIIIDSPWETGYTTFDWDPSLYPNPQAMVDYLHNLKVRVMLWQVCAVNVDEPVVYNFCVDSNYLLGKNPNEIPGVISWWKGDGALIDFYNPDAVTWWKGQMDKVLDLGIDGWKCDGTDFYSLTAKYSPYLGQNIARIDYSHKFYNLFFDYTREKLGNNRAITCRPIDNYGIASIGGDGVAFAPKEIMFCGWVGDQDATFDGMQKALDNMYWSADYGYLSFGSDIGGYREDDDFPATGRGKELFIRWAQLGAFSPVMENGGGGEHRPWMFDEQTTDIYRTFVDLHHDMVPYLMETATQKFNAGLTMMDIENTTDFRYMLGDDIFVMPVIENVTSLSVTLPAGSNWVYLFDKTQVYTGGSTFTLSVPLDEYPVFIKEGSDVLNQLTVDK